MKNLRDYLHLYIGSARVEYDSSYMRDLTPSEYGIARHVADNVKLVLRPLSDITEEEAVICYDYCWTGHQIPDHEKTAHILSLIEQESDPDYAYGNVVGNIDVVRWLLSQGFDLFGLIESGLAIDASETK